MEHEKAFKLYQPLHMALKIRKMFPKQIGIFVNDFFLCQVAEIPTTYYWIIATIILIVLNT